MEEKKNPVEIAHKLCELLNKKGIETESEFALEPISDGLRDSWYVRKVLELGHTECIFVDVSCGGFIAVLEDGKIMSGGNHMLNNAFSEIFLELELDFGYLWDLEEYYDNGKEDELVIGTLEQLEEILDNVNDSIDEGIVKDVFIETFNWMDFQDIERLWDELAEEIILDIEESADKNFNDDDVRIAIRRTLFNRLFLED